MLTTSFPEVAYSCYAASLTVSVFSTFRAVTLVGSKVHLRAEFGSGPPL